VQITVLRRFALLYIDWINACQTEAVFANQVKIIERILTLSKMRFARGDDTKLTLQQAKIRLLNAESQSKLIRYRATSIAQRLAMEAQDTSPEKADAEQFEFVMSSLLKTLPEENSIFGNNTREARLKTAEANVEASRDNWSPRLDFVARAGVTNYASNTTFTYSGQTLVPEIDIGFELSIPIYDGSTHSHATRAALLRRNAIEERNKAELALTREQIVDFLASKLMAENTKETYREVSELAKKRSAALETQLKYGTNTLFEMLNAAEDILLAERQRVSDYQQKLQSELELAVSTNRLNLEALQKLENTLVEHE
jgi:outer membrane protein TolC